MDIKNINHLYIKSFKVAQNRTSSVFSNLTKGNFKLPQNIKKDHLIYVGLGILVILSFLAGKSFAPSTIIGGTSDERTEAPKPIATQGLNKKFNFPLRDADGKEVAKITFLVESANLQDAFIYQGKLARSVKGRTFLIFNLKITNPYTKTIEINAKDYIRVKLNNSNEQLAPEIHNDPVEIQADSTKYTRIGLPINDTDKNIVILIGELQGEKETIKLSLER